MKLWEILIPTESNEGEKFSSEFHEAWESQILTIVDGLTILRKVKGKWIDRSSKQYRKDGLAILFEDINIPVRIACNEEQLEEILKFTKEYYNQRMVMAYEISNNVIFYE